MVTNIKKDAKNFITSLIKDNSHVVIDSPSVQGETTTTGNVVRRCIIRETRFPLLYINCSPI